MLRQEQEEGESEVVRVRRKWGWFRERKTGTSSTEQVEVDRAETDPIEPRLTALQRALYRRKQSLRRTTLGAGIAASGVASALISLPTGSAVPGSPSFWLSVGLLFGGEALVLMSILRGETALRAAVSALASTDDLQTVGPLAEALKVGEPSYSLVASALTRLLPRLQPSDAALLNETQRACLRHAFKQSSSRLCFWRFNPPFAEVLRRALTILDAMPSTELATGDDLMTRQSPDVETLLEQFQSAVRQRQKNAVTIGAAAAMGATAALTNVVTQMLTHQQSYTPLLGVAIGSVSITVFLSFRGLFRLKAMMNELANAGDLRVVGPLLEIAAIQDGNANPMAALLLTRLLPQLRASDATLLTDRQHTAFARSLTSNLSNPDFILAVLKALEQVGDGRALPIVESLAAGRVVTADAKRVQAAAQECLPFLQARYDQQQAIQTLLRASDISETPPDMLLRPAQGVVTPEDAELLRPGTLHSESVGVRYSGIGYMVFSYFHPQWCSAGAGSLFCNGCYIGSPGSRY